jgi:hypothetical protein
VRLGCQEKIFSVNLKLHFVVVLFDLYGLNPQNENGKHIAFSYHIWPKIWAMSFNCTNGLLSQADFDNGLVNDAHKISRKKTLSIAECLEIVIESEEVSIPNVTAPAFKIISDLIEDPNFTITHTEPEKTDIIESIKEFISFCRNSGGFKIR